MKKLLILCSIAFNVGSFAGIINLEPGSTATVYTDTDTTVRCLGSVVQMREGLVDCLVIKRTNGGYVVISDSLRSNEISEIRNKRVTSLKDLIQLRNEGICK